MFETKALLPENGSTHILDLAHWASKGNGVNIDPTEVLRSYVCLTVQGYLAHKNTPTPVGPPEGPRHMTSVGSYGAAVSYERGTPVERMRLLATYLLDKEAQPPRTLQ